MLCILTPHPHHGWLCSHRDLAAPTVTSPSPPSLSRGGALFLSTGARLGLLHGAAAACGAPCGTRLWWARETGHPALGVWEWQQRVEVGREGALWAGPGSLGAAACRRLVALTMAACPASAGRMGQAGIRAAHSCHVLSWEGHGVKQPRGPRTQGLRRLLNLPVPCLPDSLAGLSATGIGERPSLQLLKPERPPESPPPHHLGAPARRPDKGPAAAPQTTRPPPPRRPCPGSGAHGPSSRSISHGAILAAV